MSSVRAIGNHNTINWFVNCYQVCKCASVDYRYFAGSCPKEKNILNVIKNPQNPDSSEPRCLLHRVEECDYISPIGTFANHPSLISNLHRYIAKLDII